MAIQIQIHYATERLAAGLALVNVLAFLTPNSTIFANAFPNASIPALQLLKHDNALKHLANPETHVLAGLDPVTNEVVAYGRWTIPTHLGFHRPETALSEDALAAAANPLRRAPRPMNERAYRAFRGLIEEGRRKWMREGDIILDILCTLPAHQGKGIGSALLKWGMDKADAANVRVYLEATPEGYPLYVKHGWKTLEEVTLDYAQFGGQGEQKFIIMVREASTF